MRLSGIPSVIAGATAILILAAAIGAGVAVASSPSSLSRWLGATPATLTQSPGPTTRPTPKLTPIPPALKAGGLGSNPTLLTLQSGRSLVATNGPVTMTSRDGGRTWTPAALPPGAVGIAYDPTGLNHAIAGGNAVSATADGATWTPPPIAPPGPGPFEPVMISPYDVSMWFFVRGGKVLRTRDAGISWKEIPPPRPLTTATMIAGTSPDQFFSASDAQFLELYNQAAQLKDAGGLPGG